MAKPDETGALYISKLSMNGTAYTIKDAWSRAAIEDIETAIAGGTHFLGVTTTALSDGATTNPVTIADKSVTASNGDIVLCSVTEGGASITAEFIFDGSKWQQFGTQGVLKALAYKDSASGSVTLPLTSNISVEAYTPQVDKGSLAVTTSEASVSVTATAASFSVTTANATLSSTTAAATLDTTETGATVTYAQTAASITHTATTVTTAGPSVSLTYTTGTFTALKDVTYDSTTATLSISSATSDSFTKTTSVESVGNITVTYDKTSAVTYDKTSAVTYDKTTSATYTKATGATYDKVDAVTYDKASGTFLSTASLTGDLAVTAAAPTLTITNPEITVTVS